MAISRREFSAVARGLKSCRPAKKSRATRTELAEWQAWSAACRATSKVLAGLNARFDHTKFLEACGVI